MRNVTVDTIKPSIVYDTPPTPNNGSQTEDYINISMTSSDTNQHYAFVDFNQSLVGWWRMDDVSDEGEGATVYDLSSYGNDGTAIGIANQTDNGYYGKAFSFDGTGDYINVPDDNSLDFDASGNYTWSIWINPRSIFARPDIFSCSSITKNLVPASLPM